MDRKRASSRAALFALCVAALVVALLGAVSSAPALPPPPVVTLTNAPGLDSVTYGGNAAYVGKIANPAAAALRNVTFRIAIPQTDAGQALLQSATCAGTLTATEFVCNPIDRVKGGESASITTVWKVPASGSSSGCPSADPCLATSASFTVGSATYPTGPATTALLAQGDASSAATYALAPCTNTSNPTLQTNQTLSAGNPLSTSICAPTLPAGQPGLVTAIDEVPGGPPGTAPEASNICIPAPASACNTTPFVFSPKATFTFVLLNSSLPAGEVIDKVYHDGVLLTTDRNADRYVLSIKVQPFKGITTVIVKSSTNGDWRFG